MSDIDTEFATLVQTIEPPIEHHPVEQTVWDLGDDTDSDGTRVIVCGCDERFGYTWGQGEHV